MIFHLEIERELARRSFWKFCLYMDAPFFKKRPFTEEIAQGFQDIFDGKIRKLSVSLPPRGAKSYLTTLFCAFFLGNKPTDSIMRNACTATLYDKFSYDTRTIIKSQKYQEVFPWVQLQGDRQNLGGWNLTTSRQVGYFGAGVGGTIIGFGCSGCAITDDLYKSLEDALSEKVNTTVHSWKQSSHDSRLETGCPQIDIGTRWTIRDVIGQNMEKGFYDRSIVIPALNERGESFCEDVRTTAEYIETRRTVTTEVWEAEYMQNPVEAKGLLFKKGSISRFRMSELPKDPDAKLGFIDVADEGNDYLSMPVCHLYKEAIYITDVIFTQENGDVTIERCAKRIDSQNDPLDYVRVEQNGGGSWFIKMLKLYVEDPEERIWSATSTKNKLSRILNSYPYVVKYCKFLHEDEIVSGSEYDQFMQQLTTFQKNGTSPHDDAPDSLDALIQFAFNGYQHLFPAYKKELPK